MPSFCRMQQYQSNVFRLNWYCFLSQKRSGSSPFYRSTIFMYLFLSLFLLISFSFKMFFFILQSRCHQKLLAGEQVFKHFESSEYSFSKPPHRLHQLLALFGKRSYFFLAMHVLQMKVCPFYILLPHQTNCRLQVVLNFLNKQVFELSLICKETCIEKKHFKIENEVESYKTSFWGSWSCQPMYPFSSNMVVTFWEKRYVFHASCAKT